MEKKVYRLISKRNILLFFFAFSTYTGYALGNRILVCVGFACLFILVFSWHAAHNFFRDFKAERIHYDRTFENEELRVQLNLNNRSDIPIYMLEIVDMFPAGDLFWIRTLVPDKLDSEDTIELEYRVVCTRRRGVYVIGPLILKCCDPLGIHERTHEVPVLSDLLIYPSAPDLAFFEVLGSGTLSQVGVETLLRPGHSEEFTGLREYHRGDSPRRIHWPSSIRHGRMLVKEFMEDITTEVSIFLDMHRLSLSGVGDVTSVEYIIKAAAAVSRKAIEKSHQVQIFALSKKMEHVPLGGGRHHLITILDRLTYMRPRGDTTFEKDLEKYTTALKYGSTAVLIAGGSNVHPDSLSPILRSMMDRSIKIIFILIDDNSFIKFWGDQAVHRKKAIPIKELREILSIEGCELFLCAKDDEVASRLQEPL